MKNLGSLLAIACLAGCSSNGNSGSSAQSTGGLQNTSSHGSSGAGPSSGTTGTNTSSGGTTGSLPTCGPNAVWSGNSCAQTACTASTPEALCLLANSGLGRCFGTQCLDVQADPQNCGGAGANCPAGSSCQKGICTFADGGYLCSVASPCPAGQTCLGTGCVSNSCSSAAADTLCPGFDGRCCGGSCIGTGSDNQNCGGCGNVCPAGTLCLEGSCSTTCQLDNAQCYGDAGWGFCCGGACLPQQTNDSQNCGYCGLSCGVDFHCSNGDCQSWDAGYLENCAGGLISIGRGCVASSCTQGEDGLYCALANSDRFDAQGNCCGDLCVDFYTDPQNCGGCNLHCPQGAFCLSGSCAPTPSCTNAPNGTQCLVNASTRGICCDSQCVDPTSDNANCGSCGNNCPIGLTCSTPDGGPHLGTCHFGCGGPNSCPAGTSCVVGPYGCFVSSCNGHADDTPCAMDGGEGLCCGSQCVSEKDPNNCTGCGIACPSGFACNNGCVQGSNGYDCTTTGAESCPVGTACDDRECAPLGCAGRSDGDRCTAGVDLEGSCCGGNCVITSEDTNNCGGCAQTCSGLCLNGQCQSDRPQVCTPSCGQGQLCVGGNCVGSTCSASVNCLARDGTAGFCCGIEGACADLASDPLNCGACGIACPAGSNCHDGQCTGVLCGAFNQGGFCETGNQTKVCCGTDCADTSNDPNNCGRCGHTCPNGVCVDSLCH